MLNLKIGGVPEHFNYPWYLTLKNKEYSQHNINLRWKDYPEGTGKMCTALRSGELDIAIVLTEGITKDIIEGNPSKIIQIYVKSPLIWGIHTNIKSKLTTKDLKNKKAAVSRLGSGSHLMALVNAFNQGWESNDIELVEVHNIEGGIKAIKNNTADYFFWEHFTTKPYVDNGFIKRIANCPTPWPCFVIAVRNDVLENNIDEIRIILNIINSYTKKFKLIDNIDSTLSKRYDQKLEDIQKWLSKTEWNSENIIDEKFIIDVQNKLFYYNVIGKIKDPKFILKNV